jgi:hypothetical protein
MRQMTEQEHADFVIYLEEFIGIAMRKTYGYDDFMRYPYLKPCNDTFTDLLVNYNLKDL